MVAPINRLGIEMLTLLGMPPVEYVKLAATLGCAEVSPGLSSLPLAMFGMPDVLWPDWSLRDDAALRRETLAALRDTGIAIGLGEGFRVHSAGVARDAEADLDIMAQLGARRINAICMEDAMVASGAAADQFGTLADMAIARGMAFTIEFFPPTGISSLAAALDVIGQIGDGKARLLLDTTHYFRTGGSVAELAALDPALIGYVQLSDARAAPYDDAYFMNAMFARQVPGTGELPLRECIAALPAEVTISLEVPRLDDLRAGMSAEDHAARCVAAARALGV